MFSVNGVMICISMHVINHYKIYNKPNSIEDQLEVSLMQLWIFHLFMADFWPNSMAYNNDTLHF